MSGRWYVMVVVLALIYANSRLYFTGDATGNWPAGAPVGNRGQPKPPDACAVWRTGTVICVDASRVLESDRFIGLVSYAYRDRGSALDTTSVMEGMVSYTVGGSPADPAAVRTAYNAWPAKHPDKYWQKTAARLGSQAVPVRSIRWLAIFRVLGNVVLVALLIRSLAWTVPLLEAAGRGAAGATMTPAERAALRRKVVLARGECPSCEYDIRGLPTRICPECAHRWTEAEARTIPRR